MHTRHSGRCSLPVLRHFFRESCTEPQALYQRLQRLGMGLVTVTDHDSIDAAESLRRHADFFLSEEVTVQMPSGAEAHVGVYDITERQHSEIQRRRNDLPALLAYFSERRLFFSVNHVFSGLTGRRDIADFRWLEEWFPAMETLNGLMPARQNREAARLAHALGKTAVAGSDAHALASAGSAFTEVRGARTKEEFFAALRAGRARLGGRSGSYARLTRDVFHIAAGTMREHPWLLPMAPIAVLIPFWTLANSLGEAAFVRCWVRALERVGMMEPQPQAWWTPARAPDSLRARSATEAA
ncbi:MAG: PHP-associated domain-containing protein [Candidatus Acidiferrales bacterium]